MAVELVGLAEIAALFGSTKQVITNWRTRKPGFPEPAAELKSGPVWHRPEIVKWARKEGIALAESAKSEAGSQKRAVVRKARTVAVMNMKGGVGKTTLTSNLGWHACFGRDYRVLLVDLDPQFNLSQYVLGTTGYEDLIKAEQATVESLFRAEAESRPQSLDEVIIEVSEYTDQSCLHLMPAGLDLAWTIQTALGRPQMLKNRLQEVSHRYDLILIDCAPTESILSRAAYHAAQHVLIPVKPEFLSSIGLPLLQKSMSTFAEENPDVSEPQVVGIIFNDTMDKVEQAKSRREVQVGARRFNWPIFKNEISHSESYPAGARQGKPIFMTDNARSFKKDELTRVGDEFLKGIGL